jgi:hypothetical protein
MPPDPDGPGVAQQVHGSPAEDLNMRTCFPVVSIVAAAIALLTTRPASAQDVEPDAPEAAPEPAQCGTSGARLHDGFYLRFATGLGGMGLTRKLSTPADGTVEAKIDGGGGTSELSIGGTPARGFVLAGTLLTFSNATPTYKSGGTEQDLDGTLEFGMVGATVDWFLNPEKGFHLAGTLGAASAKAPSPPTDVRPRIGGSGVGLSLAVGYDFWIGDQWSIGVLGRLTVAGLTDRTVRSDGTYTEKDTVGALGVMATVLYH